MINKLQESVCQLKTQNLIFIGNWDGALGIGYLAEIPKCPHPIRANKPNFRLKCVNK